MEILSGGLIAVSYGLLVSLVLTFLFRLAWVFIPGLPESDLGSVVGFLTVGTLKISLLIGLVLAPLSFVVGLVYSTFHSVIRSAVRQGVEQGRASTPDS